MSQGKVLVTGAAGFIGSRLVRALAARGADAIALDAFRSSEAPGERARNAAGLDVRRVDLATDELASCLEGVEIVYHLAARPGVRASWGSAFSDYLRDNLLATQRLVEAARTAGVRRIVFASSSSVYGDAASAIGGATDETTPRAPISPYGVTKSACEDLLRAYAGSGSPANLAIVLLRYFTVYGPGQRPDMALRRIFEAQHAGVKFPLYGDGSQSRSWTFVEDVVDATIRAGETPAAAGETINIGGGDRVSLAEVLQEVARLTGRRLLVDPHPVAPGDVRETHAQVDKARRILGWSSTTEWREGLRKMAEWFQKERGA